MWLSISSWNGIAESLVSWVIVAFLQSSLIILAALGISHAMRRRGAAVQSAVLRTALVAVIACPVATWLISSSGITGFRVPLPRATEFASHRETKLQSRAHSQNALPIAQPFPIPLLHKTDDSADQIRLASTPTGAPEPSVVKPQQMWMTAKPLPSLQHSTSTGHWLRPIYIGFVLLWGVGATLLLGRIAIAIRIFASLRRESKAAPAQLVETCRQAAMLVDVVPPPVLLTPRLTTPCLVGVSRPAVLVPAIPENITRDVLVHELAHLKRHDCLWHLLSRLMASVIWFQPLTWLLCRRLEQSADEVCDDRAVAAGGDRAEYAQQLIDIAERLQGWWPMAGATASVVAFKSKVAHRVLRIMDTSRQPSVAVGNATVIGILMLGIGLTSLTGLVGASSAGESPVRTTSKAAPANAQLAVKRDRLAQPAPARRNGDDPIREAVAQVVEAGLSGKGFDDLIDSVKQCDQIRLRQAQPVPDQTDELNHQVAKFRSFWNAKFGHEFKISDEVLTNADKAVNADGKTASVHFAASQGLPEFTVSVMHDASEKWRVDLPCDLDSAKLHGKLIKYVSLVNNSKDTWPADTDEAAAVVTRCILLAIFESESVASL